MVEFILGTNLSVRIPVASHARHRTFSSARQCAKPRFVKRFGLWKGGYLIKLDYSQMELRATASYTNEKVMLEAYRNGEDLHRKTASPIFGAPPEEVSKEQRARGKTTNFGYIFGQGPEGFARKAKEEDNLDISIEEATHYKTVFFQTYPKLKDWHQGVWDHIHRGLITEVRTSIGRRRLIPKGTKDWPIFTSSVNVPIQGGCADANKLSIIEIREVLPEGTFLVGTVHDEVIIETDIQIAPDILKLAKGVMEKWASTLFPGVPMLAEGVIWKSWGDEE